jgi:hypothetical protein
VLAACFDGAPGDRDSFAVEDGLGHVHLVPRTVGGWASDVDTYHRHDMPKTFFIVEVSTTGHKQRQALRESHAT